VCQKFKMEIDSDVIPGIAGPFAGGIGNSGSICGAVVGAEMAIGLKQKQVRTMEGMLRNLAVAREFRNRFESEMKTISCRELTGMDLGTREGIENFMASGIPQEVCFPAVALSYRLAVDLINGLKS
jgi:C_GCAxxG_C_C family probable redox protein